MNKPFDVLPIPTEDDILGAPIDSVTPQTPPEVVVTPAKPAVEVAPVTPVIEKPAEGEVKVDLKDWEPGKIDLKDAAKKVEDLKKVEEATPPVPPAEPDGIARLRQTYEETKTHLEQAKTKALELEALKAQHEAELATLREEANNLRLKASQTDPWQHPDVQAIVAPVNDEISKLPTKLKMGKEELRNFSPANVQALTNEFLSIGTPDSQGYDDRRHGFNERLQDLFPENSTSVRDAIIKSADAAERAIEKMNVLQANGMVQSFQEVKERHQNQVKQFEETVEANMFEVSEEFMQADPYHPMSAIKTMIASSPAIAKMTADIKGLIRKAAIPPAPISPEELEKMTPEARKAVLEQREQEHRSTVQGLMNIQGPALLAYQLFGVVYKKMREYEEKLSLISSEIPGGRSPAPTPGGPPAKVEIGAWAPPPIPKIGAV